MLRRKELINDMKRSDSLSVTHITLLARASELKFTFDDQKKRKKKKEGKKGIEVK